MRRAFLLLVCAGVVWADSARTAWLSEVEPLITADERRAYQSLTDPLARTAFEEQFWQSRTIDFAEYRRRVDYADTYFGSSKRLSGLRTDQGRVYLSLGAPSKISRFPSSRIFFPLEIWYYEAPARQFIFFQRNGSGSYALYSPAQHTVRALLNPQSSTRGMFPVNDMITAADIRTRLTVGPVEDEILDAAVSVGWGIKGIGNDAEIASALAPEVSLLRRTRTSPNVTARIVTQAERPVLTAWQTRGPDGLPVVDLQWTAAVARTVGLRVMRGELEVAAASSDLPLTQPSSIAYRHRLDLLPGTYTVVLSADGRESAYPLMVRPSEPMSDLIAGSYAEPRGNQPFTYGNVTLTPAPHAMTAMVQLAKPADVQWRLWQGTTLVWKAVTLSSEVSADGFARREFDRALPPGRYELEAKAGDIVRSVPLTIGTNEDSALPVSYNANLTAVQRNTSIGRQYLSQGALQQARRYLAAAAAQNTSADAVLGLARLDALEGKLDDARERTRGVLQQEPRSFEALVLMGYIEAQLQDHEVAARYYEQALAIRPSPVVEKARAAALKLARQ